ncbi:TBC1 domain family member 31 [Holothuria leucospilota]|uniref:TBC1 domain family member 31 n=1 Tax=Holothuria leucospilota TaxID=206669 RepID=A0A9Q1CA59_HOLLE|nr:TBC1 domain family member 31 [Holothuria leucospilota]
MIVGLLSQDGIMRFVHIHECKLLFDIGSLDDRIQTAAISPTGRHIVTTTESGSLHVFSVQALMSDYNKPPAPLVKAVDGVKGIPVKSQTFSSASSYGREEVGHGQKEKKIKRGQGRLSTLTQLRAGKQKEEEERW